MYMVYMWMCMAQNEGRDQETIWCSWLSFSFFIWILEIKLRAVCLHRKCLIHGAVLPAPKLEVFKGENSNS